MTCAINSIPTSLASSADLDGRVVDDNDHTTTHYFAIGAMMNPISVKNRQLNLEVNANALPGYLMDHKLAFFSRLGFAEVVYEKGSIVHGVVYRQVPADDMKILDNIERDYIRKNVTIHCYPPNRKGKEENDDDGQDEGSEETNCLSSSSSSSSSSTLGGGMMILKNVSVYCRSQDEIEKSRSDDQPPSERYLEVILEGAQHYGVHPSYIRFLKEQKCRPRPAPSEYLTFAEVDGYEERSMTREEVDQRGSGFDGKPLYVRSRGRVIELVREQSTAIMYEDYTESFSKHGRDLELFMSKMLYDPLFGIPSCLEEVPPEQAASCEHFFCDYFKGCDAYDKWRVIARIRDQ